MAEVSGTCEISVKFNISLSDNSQEDSFLFLTFIVSTQTDSDDDAEDQEDAVKEYDSEKTAMMRELVSKKLKKEKCQEKMPEHTEEERSKKSSRRYVTKATQHSTLQV